MKAADSPSAEDWRGSSAYLQCLAAQCVCVCVCVFLMCTHLFTVRRSQFVHSGYVLSMYYCLCSRSAVAKLPFPVAHASAIGASLTTNISLTSAAFGLSPGISTLAFRLYARFGSISVFLAVMAVCWVVCAWVACQHQASISMHICKVVDSLETCLYAIALDSHAHSYLFHCLSYFDSFICIQILFHLYNTYVCACVYKWACWNDQAPLVASLRNLLLAIWTCLCRR